MNIRSMNVDRRTNIGEPRFFFCSRGRRPRPRISRCQHLTRRKSPAELVDPPIGKTDRPSRCIQVRLQFSIFDVDLAIDFGRTAQPLRQACRHRSQIRQHACQFESCRRTPKIVNIAGQLGRSAQVKLVAPLRDLSRLDSGDAFIGGNSEFAAIECRRFLPKIFQFGKHASIPGGW